MTDKIKLTCPNCGGYIINTARDIQPYSDFDNYAGFRCGKCRAEFTDATIEKMAIEQNVKIVS